MIIGTQENSRTLMYTGSSVNKGGRAVVHHRCITRVRKGLNISDKVQYVHLSLPEPGWSETFHSIGEFRSGALSVWKGWLELLLIVATRTLDLTARHNSPSAAIAELVESIQERMPGNVASAKPIVSTSQHLIHRRSNGMCLMQV